MIHKLRKKFILINMMLVGAVLLVVLDRKSTRLNSSH